MKPDQTPECWVEANDGYQVCYVMEYDVEDEMFIDEVEKELDGYYIIEVTKTCRICGSHEVYYPV